MIRSLRHSVLMGAHAYTTVGVKVAAKCTQRTASAAFCAFRAFSSEAPPPPPHQADAESSHTDKSPVEPPSEASKIEKLEAEVKDLKDKVLRSLAEEENVRRIAKRDVDNAKAYATSSMAKSLLEVADNLDLALQAAKAGGTKSAGKDPLDNRTGSNDSVLLKSLIEGVEATNKGLLKSFAQFGIVKVSYHFL